MRGAEEFPTDTNPTHSCSAESAFPSPWGWRSEGFKRNAVGITHSWRWDGLVGLPCPAQDCVGRNKCDPGAASMQESAIRVPLPVTGTGGGKKWQEITHGGSFWCDTINLRNGDHLPNRKQQIFLVRVLESVMYSWPRFPQGPQTRPLEEAGGRNMMASMFSDLPWGSQLLIFQVPPLGELPFPKRAKWVILIPHSLVGLLWIRCLKSRLHAETNHFKILWGTIKSPNMCFLQPSRWH